MTISLPLVTLATLLLSALPAHAADYSVVREVCQMTETSETVLAIRELKASMGQKSMKLVVSPRTLETSLVASKKLDCEPLGTAVPEELANTLYSKALVHFSEGAPGLFVNANEGVRAFSPSCALEKAGLANEGQLQAMSLTIDMCPAKSDTDEKHPHRPFDISYFETLQRIGQETGRPVHATIFISGGWIRMHKQDAAKLVKMNDASRGLIITFGNHSNTHPYLGNHVPSAQNFMTSMTAAQFQKEVLEAEKAMLSVGIVPSVYFRFPGLMSNGSELSELRSLGLIPVGTAAWLALDGGRNTSFAGFDFSSDQAPKAGRILLTHGNGNEELGVRGRRGILDYLAAHQNQTALVSLSDALRCSVR